MRNKIKGLILALAIVLVPLLGPAFADADAKDLPEPSSPVKAVLGDGSINVYVGTPRVNAYGIGDSIPVTVIFEMTPAANTEQDHAGDRFQTASAPRALPMPRIDVEGLKMQVQSAEALDVEMLSAADEVVRYSRDGKDYLKVVFYVWTFVTTRQTQVDVKADFSYAVNQLPDGQPDWRKATTPEIHIGIRKTATDNQTTILEGDLDGKKSPHAPAAFWLLLGGSLLVLPMFAGIAVGGYRAATRKRTLTANEKAWLVLGPAIESAQSTGSLTLEQYRSIFFTLRNRFAVLAFDGDELFAALRANPELTSVRFSVIEHVFGMESVFYAKASDLTADQLKAFIEGIKLIVPRH